MDRGCTGKMKACGVDENIVGVRCKRKVRIAGSTCMWDKGENKGEEVEDILYTDV